MAQPNIIWKKRILIPFWVIRILCMLFIIAVYALALKVISDDPDIDAPAIGVVVLFMLLIIAVLLMDVLSIILFLRDSLNVKTFLIINVLQTTFWFVVLILDLVAIARGGNAAGIAFTVFVLLTFVALLIYGSVQFRRQRKQNKLGQYAPTHNPAAPAGPHGQPLMYGNMPAPQPPAYQRPTSPYHQDTSYNSPAHEMHTPYPPQYQNHNHGAAAEFYQGGVKPASMV
ncbi:hypothetical protein EJ04DRAFT_491901 [Polyplosphaeria fusca]|uniref:Uncharacterized protein n=1 Tax=Polyplosphaeria fusca TaxID=682080 RepID=A0A9P4QWN9_9PLEO|nr:hypothetical protein EJ04DRAFT_491901 [Polyplosphaeria fusca]